MKKFTQSFFYFIPNAIDKFFYFTISSFLGLTLFLLFLFISNVLFSQTLRYASQQDVLTIPNANLGDLLITGGTETSNGLPAIYISATSNLVIPPGKKILIKGGVYDWISINNTSSGTSQNPIVITNYGGQVETKAFEIRGMSFFKLTGKYDSLQKTGDVNFKGHTAGYAWSQGKYGIFVNNKWTNSNRQLLEIRGDVFNGVKVHTTDFELEYIESGNGGYTNAFRWDDASGNYAVLDNIKIHDCYFHDMSGEGVYFGASGNQPAYELLKNLKIYNNRFIRCGRDAHQTKRTITGLRINNNVVVNPGMQGEDSQNFACNILFNDGNSIIENNIYVANPGYATIQFYPSCDPVYVATGGTAYFRNNAMLHPGVQGTIYEGARGFAMNIDQCKAGVYSLPPVAIEISNNYWGKFSPTSISSSSIIESYYHPSSQAPVYARNNTFDGTGNKTIFWPSGSITSPTINENNVIGAVPEVEFVDYEIGVGFSYDKFDMWRSNRNYSVGWYTTRQSKIYKAIASSTAVEPGFTAGWQSYWQLQTYNNGSSFFPADDVRLKPSKFKTLGMGLLDSVASQPPINISPKAIAGDDQTITLPTNSVTLIGSGTDADGTIASYKWNKISGPAQFTIVSSTTAQTAVNGLVQGVYSFELMVTDKSGALGKDTLQVTVKAAGNILPIAITGADQMITLPTNSVNLSGSGTDADGMIASYKWNKISGPAQFTIVSSTVAQTAVNGLVQGVYAFELMVTDNSGALGKDTLQVTVKAAGNILPIAITGADQMITLPTNSVNLSGSGTDADGTIASYKWNKISGPAQFTIVSSTVAQTAVNGLVQGVYAFEFVVTDNSGALGKDTIKITVLKDVEKGYHNRHHYISVKLYPNPATSNINISIYDITDFSSLRIQIYNSRGKVVWFKTLNNITELINLNVDLSALHGGIYYVNFVSNEKVLKTIHFIKL